MNYVDELTYNTREGGWHGSHLFSDKLVDLHAFAAVIGLLENRDFQNAKVPFYKVSRAKRIDAVKAGAKEVKLRQYLESLKP